MGRTDSGAKDWGRWGRGVGGGGLRESTLTANQIGRCGSAGMRREGSGREGGRSLDRKQNESSWSLSEASRLKYLLFRCGKPRGR